MNPLQHKIDFAVILTVDHANPNGDPLNGNRPRVDYDGFGEITDVCIKRKLRDRLQENGQAIFVQSDEKKQDGMTSLRNRAESPEYGLGKKHSTKRKRSRTSPPEKPAKNGSTCALSASCSHSEAMQPVFPSRFAGRSPYNPLSVSNRSASPVPRSRKASAEKATAPNGVPTPWV